MLAILQRYHWWLREIFSSVYFANVHANGFATVYDANNTYGIYNLDYEILIIYKGIGVYIIMMIRYSAHSDIYITSYFEERVGKYLGLLWAVQNIYYSLLLPCMKNKQLILCTSFAFAPTYIGTNKVREDTLRAIMQLSGIKDRTFNMHGIYEYIGQDDKEIHIKLKIDISELSLYSAFLFRKNTKIT